MSSAENFAHLAPIGAQSPSPLISVIVIVHNMNREAFRTLISLSVEYQLGVDTNDYEVIVVDNGSTPPFPADAVAQMGENFRLFSIENPTPSPAAAVNFGVKQSLGLYVGLIVDGARLLSPGILKNVLTIFRMKSESLIATLGFHLGKEIQNVSILNGYNKVTEDALLASIEWPTNGYRLFEISALAGSSSGGWFKPMAESNCLFLPRCQFDELGGYDERFNLPGGGFVNLDFYSRACALIGLELFTLLGEGSFHQIHGGVATNVSTVELERLHAIWMRQYELLRGYVYAIPRRDAVYFGRFPYQALWTVNI